MAINGYCNKIKCADCTARCALDEKIPCSPDCECLTQDGMINIKQCLKEGCTEIKYIFDVLSKSDEEIIEMYGEKAPYPY